MQKALFLPVLLLFSLLSSCSSDKTAEGSAERKSLVASIDSLEKQMFTQQNMEMDKSIAAKELQLYQEFVNKFPLDSMSAEYMFRSSELARALGDNVKSIEYLSNVCKNYPAYKKIPECLFLQGYYYQEFFGDTTQARNYYMQLMSKYPEHPFVDDAKALIQMFGKTEEDIIKEFERKAAEKK